MTEVNRFNEVVDNGFALPRAFPDPLPFDPNRPSIGFGFSIYPEENPEQVAIWKAAGQKNNREGPNLDVYGQIASIDGPTPPHVPVIYTVNGNQVRAGQIKANLHQPTIEIKKAGPLWVLTVAIKTNNRNQFRLNFQENPPDQLDQIVRYASSFAYLTSFFSPTRFQERFEGLNPDQQNQINNGTHAFTNGWTLHAPVLGAPPQANMNSIQYIMRRVAENFNPQENWVTACVIEKYNEEFEPEALPELEDIDDAIRPAILDRRITRRTTITAREQREINRAEREFQRDVQDVARRRQANRNAIRAVQDRNRRLNDLRREAPWEGNEDNQRARITFGRAIRRNAGNHAIATYKQVYHELKTYLDLYDEVGDNSQMSAGRLRLIYTPLASVNNAFFNNNAGAAKNQLTAQIKKANKVDVQINGELYWDVQSTEDDCLFACINFCREHSYGKLKINDSFNVESTDGSIMNIIMFMRRLCGVSPHLKIDISDPQVMQEICNALDIKILIEFEDGQKLDYHSQRPKFVVDLFYHNEHVLVKPFDILEPRPCPTCYKKVTAWYHQCTPPPNYCGQCNTKYRKNHKCDPRRIKFTNNQKQQQITETKKRYYAAGMNQEDREKKIQKLVEGYYPHGQLRHSRMDYNLYMDGAKTEIDTDVLFYDMETFTDENNFLRCYALRSRIGNSSKEFIGEDAVSDFLRYLSTLRPRVYSYTDKKGQVRNYTKSIILNAWNGSSFDHHILLQEIFTKREEKLGRIFDNIHVTQLAINGSSIMRAFLTFKDLEENNDIKGPHFRFHDSCLFIKSSLSAACREFGVSSDNKKTFFPHKMVTDYDILTLAPTLEQLNDPKYYFERDIPNSEYVEDSIIFKPYTADDLKEFLREDGYTYNLYEMCSEYLRRDVDSMYDIVKKFYTEVNELWRCDLYQFVTISQFTYDMWWDLSGYKSNIINGSAEVSNFIRQAVYGGRVYSTKRHYEGESDLTKMISIDKCYKVIDGLKFENALKLDFEKEDGLVELDVTSLYPAAMQFNKYPIGIPIRITADYIEQVNAKLKRDYDTGIYMPDGFRLPLGVYEITFIPNPFIIHPVLPVKTSAGTHYNLLRGHGIYTSVDINMAIESQYLVQLSDGYEWLESSPVFEEYIKRAYKMKEDGAKEKNKVKRKTGKLLVNGLYGKTIQKPIEDVVTFCSNDEEITQSLKTSYPTDVIFLGESSWLIEGKKFVISEPKPVQLGAFVLSYSRKIMYDFSNQLSKINFMDRMYLEECYLSYQMNPFDHTFQVIIHKALEDTWWYSDTDSIYVRKDQKHLFNLDGELGNLKDESQDTGVLLHAVFLGKKNYGYVYLNKKNEVAVSLKTKGMDKSWLNMADYFTAYQKPDAQRPLNLPKFHFRPRIVGNNDSLRKNKINNKFEKLFSLEKTGLSRQFMKTLPCHRVYVDEESLKPAFDGNYSLPHGHVLDPYKIGEQKYQEKLMEFYHELKLDSINDEEELSQLLDEIDLECQRSAAAHTHDILRIDIDDEEDYVSECDLSDFVESD